MKTRAKGSEIWKSQQFSCLNVQNQAKDVKQLYFNQKHKSLKRHIEKSFF